MDSRQRPWAIGISLHALLIAAAIPCASEIPRVVERTGAMGAPPIWVSAEEAVDENGALRNELLSESARGHISRQLTKNHADLYKMDETVPVSTNAPYLNSALCNESSMVFAECGFVHGPRDSIASLSTYARLIVTGEISDIAQGFYFGQPGSLLKVEIRNIYKNSNNQLNSRTLLLFYPYAVFPLADAYICAADVRYSYLPEHDDFIVLLMSHEPRGKDHLIYKVDPIEIFAAKDDGTLFIPEALAKDSRLSTVENIDNLIAILDLPDNGVE